MSASFALARLPEVAFGEGTIAQLPERAAGFGRRALIVTGKRSFRASPRWATLIAGLEARGVEWRALAVSGEPSPALVDGAVREHRDWAPGVVLAIGGGSALDTGKAIAGLLPSGRSVMDHLEQVGRGVPYEGPATPLVAAPTTAGTGSEATRNAVLSEPGPNGFKKSFRHDALVPRLAVVDPDLLEGCPPAIIAADGMDALTQLLEGYLSPRASTFTDALAESGLVAVRDGLLAWHSGAGDPAAARARMAYAALLSGIVLAHAGLGAVHGLASPIGAFFGAPHGAVCGTLLAATTSANVAALRARDPRGVALAKYARAWALLASETARAGVPEDAPERLAGLLSDWTRRLDLPRLAAHGMGVDDIPRVVAAGTGSSMRTNPVVLAEEELAEVLRRRL